MSSCPRLERLPATEPAPGLRLASATSRRARTLGLMGVADLPEGWALHIDRTSSVHTFWMRFALDLIWLDRQGAVLRVDRAVPRRRMRWCRGARSVIEARAGEGDRFVAAGTNLKAT